MHYRQLIKKVQDSTGMADYESEEALQLMVETVAVHLSEAERKDFARQLPTELEDIALVVLPTDINSQEDIIDQFMELQDIDEGHAKEQIKAAWHALSETVSNDEMEDIRSQLPQRTAALLS